MASLLSLRRPPRAPLQPMAPPAAAAFRQSLLWLLVSVTMTMVALFMQVPKWSMALFVVCTVWRYVLARRNRPLPSMLVRLLVFLPVAAGMVMTYGTSVGASAMLTFLIALLSLKILELRSARDLTVVSLLGFFMVLCGFFYNQSLLLCLYLSVALLANTVALIRCHSGDRWPLGPVLRLALGLTAQALPLVALLFVVFPRVQGTFLRRLGSGSTGTTGMSEHLHPGSFSALVQSTEPAFRVKIGDGAIMAQPELYWRGLVLDICESSMSWKADPQGQFGDGTVPPPRPGAHRIEQQFTLYTQGERWLYALDRPVGIKPSSTVKAQLSTSDVLQSPGSLLSSKVIYTAVSETGPSTTPLTPRRREFYTRIPSDVSARVRQLAQSWRQPGRPDVEVIRAAREFFRTGGFAYTLNPGRLPGKEALDYFLFRSRRGFCEHYAAAFCALLRAANIPSRIVLGYQGGEYNSVWGAHYIVMQSDAHAWTEAWVEGRGWQREDPTALVAPDRVSLGAENYSADASLSAEARLERLSAMNVPGSWRWMLHHALLAWDGMDEQWNVFILGFDQDKQQSALQALGMGNLSLLTGTGLVLAAAVVILLLGTAVMYAFEHGRPVSDDPVRRLYARFCRRLAAVAGLHRAASEGPLDFARRASSVLPGQAAAIDHITGLYVAARYAPALVPERGQRNPALSALREAVRRFHPPKS